MHIASAAPRYATRDEVPEEEVEASGPSTRSSDEVQSKPEQAREKIVEGMVNKRFFAARRFCSSSRGSTSTEKTVARRSSEEGLKVLDFERFALAE